MENLAKKNYYNMLYGYYQPLLTKKQCQVFESYYFEDYSLAEISENLGVSRNAVWDLLKHVVSHLERYEAKLQLYQKNQILLEKLNLLINHVDEDGLKILNTIKEME